MIAKLHQFLFKKVDASTLSLFRIFVGLVMIYQILYYYKIDYTYQFISGPQFLFQYPYLKFFVPLSPILLKILLGGMLISAIGITLGILYRYACTYLFLVFSYFSFVDKTLYNNHLYLFALILFVMIFLEADKKYSITNLFSKGNKKTNELIPNWNLFLLKFLIFITYFFGGIAKLQGDWISGRIPEIMVKESNGSFLHQIFPKEFLVNLVNYGGVAYDLGIVFLLLYKPTRILAILMVLFFNIINAQVLFNDIGVFPYFMILATVLFMEPKTVSNFIASIFPNKKEKQKSKKTKVKKVSTATYSSTWTPNQKFISSLIVFFVIIHLILPFRYLAYTDNPEWTGIGARFAWRMKMQINKVEKFTMSFTDRKTGSIQDIDYKSFLSSNQLKNMINDPFSIIQFAKFLHKKAEEQGQKDPIVKANISVHFNGRPPQLMINPDIDLSKVDESPSADYSWIVPLKKIE